MNIDHGVNIGCDRFFCIAFNKKFSLHLISSFIKPNQPKVRGEGFGQRGNISSLSSSSISFSCKRPCLQVTADVSIIKKNFQGDVTFIFNLLL